MAQKIIRREDGTFEKVEEAAETAKKAASATAKKVEEAVESGSRRDIGLRIGAIVLWLLAIGCEILAIMALMKDFAIGISHNPQTNIIFTVILFIVLDLIFAIVAAQLWKKANRINPPSEKNKFTFYLISELGVIMACICFIPLIIILLKNDKLDKKSKTIVTLVAVAALLITGFASADYDPVSAEEKANAEQVLDGVDIYWTQFGHKFHLDEHCQSIENSAVKYMGDIGESIETGRTSLCSFCEHNHPDIAELLSNYSIDDVGELIDDLAPAD